MVAVASSTCKLYVGFLSRGRASDTGRRNGKSGLKFVVLGWVFLVLCDIAYAVCCSRISCLLMALRARYELQSTTYVRCSSIRCSSIIKPFFLRNKFASHSQYWLSIYSYCICQGRYLQSFYWPNTYGDATAFVAERLFCDARYSVNICSRRTASCTPQCATDAAMLEIRKLACWFWRIQGVLPARQQLGLARAGPLGQHAPKQQAIFVFITHDSNLSRTAILGESIGQGGGRCT